MSFNKTYWVLKLSTFVQTVLSAKINLAEGLTFTQCRITLINLTYIRELTESRNDFILETATSNIARSYHSMSHFYCIQLTVGNLHCFDLDSRFVCELWTCLSSWSRRYSAGDFDNVLNQWHNDITAFRYYTCILLSSGMWHRVVC